MRPLPLFSLLAQVKGKLRFIRELICHYVVQPWCVMQTHKLESIGDKLGIARLQVAVMRMCLKQAHNSYTVTG